MASRLIIISLFACGSEAVTNLEPETIEQAIYKKCVQHLDNPTDHAYCLYSKSARIPTIERAQAYCDGLGEMALECRYNWVSSRIVVNSGFTTDELLNFCNGHNDCGFKVIDARPNSDLLDVFRLCREFVPKYKHECYMHAVQRWWRAKPTAEDVNRFLFLKSVPSADLPKYMAYVVHCDGIGKCDAKSKISQECNRHINDLISSKLSCPQRNPNPQDGNRPRKPKK